MKILCRISIPPHKLCDYVYDEEHELFVDIYSVTESDYLYLMEDWGGES